MQFRFKWRSEHVLALIFFPTIAVVLILGGCGGGFGMKPSHTTGVRPTLPPAPYHPPPAEVPLVDLPGDVAQLSTLDVRLRYAVEQNALTLEASQPVTAHAGGQQVTLPPGTLQFRAQNATPARTRVHVFTKIFEPHEAHELQEHLEFWRERGYAPEIEVFGKRIMSANGRYLDNRQFWVSLARVPNQAEAARIVKHLADVEEVWAWTRQETMSSGTGQLQVTAGGRTYPLPAPVTLESRAPIALHGIQHGFWRDMRGDSLVPAPLQLEINPDSALVLYGTQPLEHYLRGVLPAEMPASWPAAALEAQAVSARSEAFASVQGKHRLEGFDFCTLEHCRAYRGIAGHTPSTDTALIMTTGKVLVGHGRVVPTFYSSNCGGWTEDNEIVWAGKPDRALRAVGDFPKGSSDVSPLNIAQWVSSRPPAYCAEDANGYRWTRRHSVSELSAMVNKYYRVGTIRSIEPGPRGAGGRLQSVRVVGSQGTRTIEQELNIRLAFGSLPSAVFTLESGGGHFTFRGAGRGHGVGLCQHGARGMAARGYTHDVILRQYFAGVAIERLD